MNQILEKALEGEFKNELNFEIGDTIKVHYKIVESGKERIQVYEGVVISIANKGASKTFTVRRISYDIGVERIFPLHSPRIARLELVRKGSVRRAKLFYLREKTGKSGRIKERKGGQAMVAKEKKRQDEAIATKAAGTKAAAAEPLQPA
ncbi:50S ribosomal protein L19 [Leptospira ilyithenensis]|uniref:Large ribosomal subunit protein bL19 n=1 Tax=Leptospira ilyithenensis TaxID=2484901 RepID=A0A4R9LL34_9LEPT|nr:50S ribosomal protein L19 [Leptospira ilyithenensis]TGN08262.1 50S ribosomal protein L19 [Leptospira ilyithenensis]